MVINSGTLKLKGGATSGSVTLIDSTLNIITTTAAADQFHLLR